MPDLRHVDQTFIFCLWPLMTTVTCWMFGRNLRLVTRCEWLIERPATACLPQMAQTLDIVVNLH